MNVTEKTAPNGAFAALRRFAHAPKVVERCDFCGAELYEDHRHLIEPERRRLVCVCGACAVLFGGHGETSYRRVPQRILYLKDFRLTDAQWEGLLIPIQLAFFFHSSPAGRVIALYPSPAGPTESSLDLAMWDELAHCAAVGDEFICELFDTDAALSALDCGYLLIDCVIYADRMRFELRMGMSNKARRIQQCVRCRLQNVRCT